MSKFDHWLKKNLEVSPSKKLDDKVLGLARAKLKSSPKNFWLLPVGSLAAAGFAGFFFFSDPNLPMRGELFVPTDLLFYQEDLELMVEAAPLSDEDWEKILGEAT